MADVQMADPMDVDVEVQASDASAKYFEDKLDQARDLETKDSAQAIKAYKDIILNMPQDQDDPQAKFREKAIYALGDHLVNKGLAQEISTLSKDLRPLFADLPKAKTAKLVRHLIDLLAKTSNSTALQIEMCKDCIKWCTGEKRTFLRHRVETRLAALYLHEMKYQDSLELLTRLLSEVKKLDDKLLLVEIHLIECRIHYAVQNLPKAKAGLTSSKTNANAIHCPPLLQADIDILSGIISAQEKDFRTAYSYFYEAFEAFNQAETASKVGTVKMHDLATTAMKYMLLTKIMVGRPKETNSIISSKSGLKYTGPEIDAMAAVAAAHEARCLKKFEAVLEQYKVQLSEDPVIKHHLSDLNETLLEQNIIRILEPFSRVEIAHVAELIELPLVRTQAKLSEMILDQKLNGTLDQGIGVLIVFDQEQVSSTYDNALKTIKNTSEVLDTLYNQAKTLA
eukprot:CAMPEP_0115084030 /NCGR_PEP_ID=MMETSP0227-20121206/20979_1 /TAXON_ID=89957 /ORGANISM="Polarella glacialis, Strain CCMP 1383" /LENGTH=452 /DNA_ID=CAMNT_0002472683 /DNA_START=76 /DNA_END=1434 /DNA_ORIENTATION=-